jgi:UDP-N-acetylglucosamine--N-acetylmuramyl-(pentapeptide) pyrophosphoryl-undecaprenol N-acetylglucosamine transferase
LISGFTREALLEMARKARALAKPDATRRVAEACMELAR